MAVAKKDQSPSPMREWCSGSRRDGKERVVPPFWYGFADGWFRALDAEPIAGAARPNLSVDQLEAELESE